MRMILYAKYYKADLNKVMTEKYQHLKTKEHKRLLILLKNFEDMFDGTLGTWNTTPLDLELREDSKPVCLQPYPVLRVHKAMFRKEAGRLVSLGVLEEENAYEWGAPLFDQPKAKTNFVIL